MNTTCKDPFRERYESFKGRLEVISSMEKGEVANIEKKKLYDDVQNFYKKNVGNTNEEISTRKKIHRDFEDYFTQSSSLVQGEQKLKRRQSIFLSHQELFTPPPPPPPPETTSTIKPSN